MIVYKDHKHNELKKWKMVYILHEWKMDKEGKKTGLGSG